MPVNAPSTNPLMRRINIKEDLQMLVQVIVIAIIFGMSFGMEKGLKNKKE